MIKALYELYSKHASVSRKTLDLVLLFIVTWTFAIGDWLTGVLLLAIFVAGVNLTTVRGALKEALELVKMAQQELDACRQKNTRLIARNKDTIAKVNHILSDIEPEGRRLS
jgi:hypothetical protein